jgi:hypothetical protein
VGVDYKVYIRQLEREGHRDVHLETGPDGKGAIVLIPVRGLFAGQRVRYNPETDFFEPLPERATVRKQR